MPKFRVTYEITVGNGKPSRTATQVNAKDPTDAAEKVMRLHDGPINEKIKIISVEPIK